MPVGRRQLWGVQNLEHFTWNISPTQPLEIILVFILDSLYVTLTHTPDLNPSHALLSLTQGLIGVEAHDGHGLHGLGEVISVALARDRDGAPAQKAVLVRVPQQQVGWGEERPPFM